MLGTGKARVVGWRCSAKPALNNELRKLLLLRYKNLNFTNRDLLRQRILRSTCN